MVPAPPGWGLGKNNSIADAADPSAVAASFVGYLPTGKPPSSLLATAAPRRPQLTDLFLPKPLNFQLR